MSQAMARGEPVIAIESAEVAVVVGMVEVAAPLAAPRRCRGGSSGRGGAMHHLMRVISPGNGAG
jgi:hypothetical protein